MPQVWLLPALRVVNVPLGTPVSCPSALSPQQATVPSVLIAHVWLRPALTEPATRPPGWLAWVGPAGRTTSAKASAEPTARRRTRRVHVDGCCEPYMFFPPCMAATSPCQNRAAAEPVTQTARKSSARICTNVPFERSRLFCVCLEPADGWSRPG